MSTVTFAKNFAAFEIDETKTLMQALLDHGVPVASSCRGDGVCGKCRVRILSATPQPLPPPNFNEQRLMEKFIVQPNERISCQLHVPVACVEIKIDTSYW